MAASGFDFSSQKYVWLPFYSFTLKPLFALLRILKKKFFMSRGPTAVGDSSKDLNQELVEQQLRLEGLSQAEKT